MGGITVTDTALTCGDSVLEPTACSTVTLQNSSGRAASSGSSDWYIHRPSGAIAGSTLHGGDNYLRTGDIIDGGTASGDVCFDVDLADGPSVPACCFAIGLVAKDGVVVVRQASVSGGAHRAQRRELRARGSW